MYATSYFLPQLQALLSHNEKQTLCFDASKKDVIHAGFHIEKPTLLKVLERIKYDKNMLTTLHTRLV